MTQMSCNLVASHFRTIRKTEHFGIINTTVNRTIQNSEYYVNRKTTAGGTSPTRTVEDVL